MLKRWRDSIVLAICKNKCIDSVTETNKNGLICGKSITSVTASE